MISTRHAQANNSSFPTTYDADLPKQNLIYLDANNLYGWVMLQSLPTQRNLYIETTIPFQ